MTVRRSKSAALDGVAPMRTLVYAAMFVALSARGGLAPAPRAPVLVELFTSEGCSSCPAADALLESLQREQPVGGAEVIPVGLHVDYFNDLGWKDAFSSASFTARQKDYSQVFGPDSVYTPQIVVDGREAVVGNDRNQVRRAIESAADRPHLPLRVTARVTADRLHITIDLPGAPPNTERIDVFGAITEDDVTSVVKRGENSGRTLHHVAVARKIERLQSLTSKGSVLQRQLQIARRMESARPENRRVAAGCQLPPGVRRRRRTDCELKRAALVHFGSNR